MYIRKYRYMVLSNEDSFFLVDIWGKKCQFNLWAIANPAISQFEIPTSKMKSNGFLKCKSVKVPLPLMKKFLHAASYDSIRRPYELLYYIICSPSWKALNNILFKLFIIFIRWSYTSIFGEVCAWRRWCWIRKGSREALAVAADSHE